MPGFVADGEYGAHRLGAVFSKQRLDLFDQALPDKSIVIDGSRNPHADQQHGRQRKNGVKRDTRAETDRVVRCKFLYRQLTDVPVFPINRHRTYLKITVTAMDGENADSAGNKNLPL